MSKYAKDVPNEVLDNNSRRLREALRELLLNEIRRMLKGKLLTQVDAVFSDKEQRKAMKDLFSQIVEEHHIRVLEGATKIVAQLAVVLGHDVPEWWEFENAKGAAAINYEFEPEK